MSKIEYGFGGDKLNISNIKATYSQPADSNSSDYQELEIETADAGGGLYYVIKTERFAFDDIDDLINILNDFKNRI